MSDPSDPNSYTVGWVCALSTEFTAAQEQFDEEYEPHEAPEHREANDFNVCSFGKIKGHMVVVAVLPNGQYGTASAAAVAKDMIRSFRNIRFGLMVGIGGGAPTKQHDIRLGDVVVSSPTAGQSGIFQHDFGKATKEGFQHTASHNKPPPLLLAAVAGLKTQYERKGLQIHDKVNTIISSNKRLKAKYGRPEDPDSLFAASVNHKSDPCHEFCVSTPTDLIPRTTRQEPLEDVEVHYGTMASGNTLLNDTAKRDELASKSNVLCFEMEAAGLMDGFRCLIIRGICDYCDSHKSDKWQGYAAMTAAVYAKQILGRIRPEAVAREETMVSKIDEVISGVADLKRSIAEQEVLDWLSDEDFGAYQFDERSKKAPGTCQWFLDSLGYQSWTQMKDQVLFCPGIAGAGKTVLASAVVENLHSRFQTDSSIVILHIYCRYNRVDRQTCNKLRASLLRQLCERLSTLPRGIMQLYNEYKPLRVEIPPERIISELKAVSDLFSKVFMVVDALDEWATEQGDLYSLPAELLLLQRKLAINLLATSRPIPLIADQFKKHHSISITAQQQDIYTYVDNFRWPESSCIGKIPKLRELVKRTMSQIVRGMFLLARLYLHSLENETSERDVKDALKQFEDRAKINDLDPKFDIVDQAYNDTLKRLREQHQNSSDLAFRVLAWVCCTRWKLPMYAIQDGLTLREGDVTFHADGIVDKRLMISVCCGLVEITKGAREIQLAHYTAEGFFRRNRHLIDEYFLVRHSLDFQLPSNADAYLARQCVTCLSIGLPGHRPGGIDTQPIYSEAGKYNNPEIYELIKNPLYEYGAFNWAGHVRRLSPLDKTYKTSIDFLQARGMVGEAVLTILNLGTWLVNWSEIRQIQISQDMSILHLAALYGLVDLAESLMKNIDVNSRDRFGRTALVWAIECFAFEFKSIANDMKPGTRNSDLYDGIHIDRRRIIEALLRSGADPHVPGCNGDTALHLAAMLGDVEIVQNLLDYGADIHTSNIYGDIPLVLAVRCGKGSAYMKLLERGAVDVCGRNSRTALIEAAAVGDLALIEKLIRKGANVDHQDHKGDTALMKACIDDQADVIELLLAANARLGIKNAEGETALSNAAQRCEEGSIKRLLRHSRNPAIRDQHAGTVLISASQYKRLDIVSLILEDAELKPASKHIDIVLSESCSREREKVVRLLIARGANPNTKSTKGGIPRPLLTHAIYEAGDAVVLLLLEAGIDIETEDNGEAPIHAAAQVGTKTMVLGLLEKGFSVNHRSRAGLLPLDYAMKRQDKDTSIADLLRKHGGITEAQRLVRLMRDRRKKID
ncbi:ankyrin protein [Fusarium phyllophilum]|uniref:Ankyrin protein n=1 Tax=Fusarium phyllophilum TaxID=47803 RepID=A0A8H5JLX9_9HYPO|nr:ankyrin protein [Fusarium phyllophilum]